MTKLCECGCGAPAPIAKKTNTRLGIVKGQPQDFIHGHYRRAATPERRSRAHRASQIERRAGEYAGTAMDRLINQFFTKKEEPHDPRPTPRRPAPQQRRHIRRQARD